MFVFLLSKLMSYKKVTYFPFTEQIRKFLNRAIVRSSTSRFFSVPAYKLSNGYGTIIMQLNNTHIRITFSVNSAVINVSKNVSH